MPLKGVTAKQQRQYRKIKASAQKSGHGRRAKEIAARTVMKQRSRKGAKKATK
jgi:hypothetical protein